MHIGELDGEVLYDKVKLGVEGDDFRGFQKRATRDQSGGPRRRDAF